jgi:hypothetical protein
MLPGKVIAAATSRDDMQDVPRLHSSSVLADVSNMGLQYL